MIDFFSHLSLGILVSAIFIGFIGLVSQMALYAKSGQPAIAALIPFWNIIVFCKVIGRPVKHSLLIILPLLVMIGVITAYWGPIDGLFPVHGQNGDLMAGPTMANLSSVAVPFSIMGIASIPMGYLIILMFIEVCDSFGKHKTSDKILCIIFNGIYILFALGVSDAKYEAPWYKKKNKIPYDIPDFKHKGNKIHVDPNAPEGEQVTIVDTATGKVEMIGGMDLATSQHRTRVGRKVDSNEEIIATKTDNSIKKEEENKETINAGNVSTSSANKKVEDKKISIPKEVEKEKEDSKPEEKTFKTKAEKFHGESKGTSNKSLTVNELRDKYKKKS